MKIQTTSNQRRRRGKRTNQRKYEQTNRKTEIEKKER